MIDSAAKQAVREFAPTFTIQTSMSGSLNVIALISGGKDSLYSLLHSIQNGHRIVALANLYPPVEHSDPDDEEGEDLNSFMYQTVGHSVIPLYAKALQLPLFRRQIAGSAVETGRYYSYNPTKTTPASTFDETEDLIPLLREILATHPEANAISTGAIQSTYQRTRIESIASRLGLTPLAYLWQYPVLPPPLCSKTRKKLRDESVTGLLDDMAAAGCQSRIIKIASGGIRESLLWSDVTDIKTRIQLVNGLQRYFEDDELGLRGAVVGEGGEFETLALSGPPSVWLGGRIVFDQENISTYSGDGGTSYVKLKGARINLWPEKQQIDFTGQLSLVRTPDLFDEQFEIIRERMTNSLLPELVTDRSESSALSLNGNESCHSSSMTLPKMSYVLNSSMLQVANITYLTSEPNLQDEQSVAGQMKTVASLVPRLLLDISTKHSIIPHLSSSDIVATTLLLRNMTDFTSINPVYGSIFQNGVPNPPARITISAPLPEGIHVMLSIIVNLDSSKGRRGLHVQSRSYWAPANIGPYSQAITSPLGSKIRDQQEGSFAEVVYVAGQIPLEPASMNLFMGSFAEQITLSLQHLWRIGQDMNVELWMFAVTFLPHETSDSAINHKVHMAAKVWKEVYNDTARHFIETLRMSKEEDEDEIDVWHLQNNRGSHAPQQDKSPAAHHLHQLPTIYRNLKTDELDMFIPPFIAAEVTALPRYASIEWWSTGIARLRSEEGCVISHISYPGKNWSIIRVKHKHNSRVWSVFVTYIVPKDSTISETSFSDNLFEKALYDEIEPDSIRAFLTSGSALVAEYAQTNWKSAFSSLNNILTRTMSSCHVDSIESLHITDCVSVIPCYRLWGHVGMVLNEFDIGQEESLVDMLNTALLLRFDSM